MTHSKKSRRRNKPAKPYPDFPLTPHPSGRWCKKIRGKLHYFGPLDDPDGALQRYLDTKDDLHAGRTPRVSGDGLTVADLCNRFLTAKRHLLDSGELTQRTFADYHTVCEKIVESFGRNRRVDDLAADDFDRFRAELAKGRGSVRLGNDIRQVRMVFKYAWDAGLIEKPIRFGPHFKQPAKRILRQQRQQNGPRMFESDELRAILDAADPIMQCMVLLGINCGFGQSDISSLPVSAVDLENGWIDFPRPKTSIERQCPLWPETSEALQHAIGHRPRPNDQGDERLVFITRYGRRWVRTDANGGRLDGVGRRFNPLLERLGLKRRGLGFYAIRHTFETIAGESRDQVAVDAIMGHVDQTMAGAYRERISDERLRAVVETVRKWLWP